MTSLRRQQEDSVLTVTDDGEDVIVAWRGGPVTIRWQDGREETHLIDDSVYVAVEHVPALIEWLQALLAERAAAARIAAERGEG